MKKFTALLLLIILGFVLNTTPVEAGFWSRLFGKETKVETTQAQEAPKTSFWSKITSFFKKEELPPIVELVPEPALDTKITENKIDTLEKINNGKYIGNKQLNFEFSQEEITKVLLPYINKEITLKNSTNNQIQINSIKLSSNTLGLSGYIEKPLKGDIYLEVMPSITNGQIKIVIISATYKGIPLGQGIINSFLNMAKINPDNLVFPAPNAILQELSINPDSLTISGQYTK